VDALLLLAVIAFAVWLLARPPCDARDATVRLVVVYAVLFTLAPSTRYGYYAYPLALVGWLALTGGSTAGLRSAFWRQRARAAAPR
jgi:phosphatidylinositol alpha-1,6-mannosyltransferase